MRYLSTHPRIIRRFVWIPRNKYNPEMMWQLSFLGTDNKFIITYHSTWEGAIAYLCLNYRAKLVKTI